MAFPTNGVQQFTVHTQKRKKRNFDGCLQPYTNGSSSCKEEEEEEEGKQEDGGERKNSFLIFWCLLWSGDMTFL